MYCNCDLTMQLDLIVFVYIYFSKTIFSLGTEQYKLNVDGRHGCLQHSSTTPLRLR